jgi:superfamily I DNA/RNA helicase/mRNA-degrading endonuclease RelE of RelBE toxin-antitoxin system
MPFEVSMKSSFRADFLNLNKDMQKRVDTAIKDLEEDPATPRGNTIKKLRYHDKLWRYRIGDYRMVYAAYPSRGLVQLLGIGPRGEIYERMNYHPDEPEYSNYSVVLENALDPDQETPAEWLQYLQPQEEDHKNRDLPYHLTAERLLEWRIPSEFHHFFIGCETEDDLLNSGAPQSQILHLVDCLWPASAAEMVKKPNLVIQNPEDLSRYAAGDLLDFLLLLDADQERFVDWALEGPTLVKGGPGSGKSTVAMYRVRALVEAAAQRKDNVRVLFTTYTKALVAFSEQLIQYLLEDIKDTEVYLTVNNLDALAWRIVNEVDGRPKMARTEELSYALTSGRANFRPNSQSPLESAMMSNALSALRDDYLLEEIEWVIEGQGITTLGGYLQADRTGRGYAFDQRMRAIVWTLYEQFKSFLSTLGKMSWGGLRSRALELVQSGEWQGEKWDYVIIDEAQDLTPAALSLCIELCESPQGVFLTADASQSLYNKGFAWKNVHESLQVVGRTRILRRNYRTTRQIATAAASILRGTGAGDEEALDQTYIHVGPKPTIYEAQDATDGYLWLANHLTRALHELHMPSSAIAILAPQNWQAEDAALRLTEYGLQTHYITGQNMDLNAPVAKAMTIHACKGLEFPIIAMPFIEEGIIPRDLHDNRADDLEKHLAGQRRLLYVGMTRAMRRLFVIYRQGQPSPFLAQLGPDLWETDRFD